MTQQELKKHLHYNQDTGIFTWKKSTTSYVKKREQKWVARIKVNCKDNHLGYFHDKEDAINARNAANVKYNYHVNHGI